MGRSLGQVVVEAFYYNTVKIVKVQSWKLGLIHHLFQLAILLYVIGFSIIYQKGYQDPSPIVGNISVKVKGNGYFEAPDGSITIWDSTDVVMPPKEENALFVTTSFLNTTGQTRGKCTGTEEKYLFPGNGDVTCDSKHPCPKLASTTSGLTTGKCVDGKCEIYAWCPVEEELPGHKPGFTLTNVGNFTVFVRATVKFPKYQVICTNDNDDSLVMGRNLFSMESVVQQSGYAWDDIKDSGVVVGMFLRYNCDLDKGTWWWANPKSCPSDCKPQLIFTRLDDPTSKLSKGYNYRYATYSQNSDGTTVRDLIKVYGARLVFVVSGSGGKFSIVQLLVKIGAGLGLLGVATIVSDFIALQLWPNKGVVSSHKYEAVDENEEQPVPENCDEGGTYRRFEDNAGPSMSI